MTNAKCVINLVDIVKNLEIKTTSNVYEADLVTHDATFHADEVVASVIAALYLNLSKGLNVVKICRTSYVPKDLNEEVIVYDVGGGRFDHHNIKDSIFKVRRNGVPYAAAGLIWRTFGNELIQNTPDDRAVWFEVERKLIRGIDAIDNGTLPPVDYPASAMSISNVISSFNPNWDDDIITYDEAFLEALSFAGIIFDNIFKRALSKVKAKKLVEESIERADGEIMIMECFLPWTKHLLYSENPNAEKIKFVIYKSQRGGFEWHTVPKGKTRDLHNIPRVSVPEAWRGLRDEDLQKVTGIPTAIFCHLSGMTGSAETLEDTIAMVKLAIASEKR